MWIILTQVSSVTDAIKNILLKSTPKEVDSVILNWAWLFFTILILLPLGLMRGIPAVDSTFWVIIALRMIMDPIAIYLFTQSMRASELSLVLPLLTFGPVFTILSSIPINGEIPKPAGLVGFILVLIGMYFLFLKPGKNFLSPFEHLFERSSLYMLIAAMIWGVQVSLFKKGVIHSNPGFFTLVGTIGIFLVFTVIVLAKFRKQIPVVFNKRRLVHLSLLGLFDGLTVFFRMSALSYGLAGYVAALNRTSIVFSSILGMALYKEPLGKRIVPIVIMILGVCLVTLA